jgi:hypothetical protein
MRVAAILRGMVVVLLCDWAGDKEGRRTLKVVKDIVEFRCED